MWSVIVAFSRPIHFCTVNQLTFATSKFGGFERFYRSTVDHDDMDINILRMYVHLLLVV